MKKNSVSVVIPNFNGEALLVKNLPHVFAAMDNSKNLIGEIIIVDDASKDGSVSLIKTRFPNVRLIKHKINRGFPAAVNTGVRMAKGELVALLNTDVVPSDDFLENVIPHFENSKAFGVSLNEGIYGWAKGKFRDGFVVHEPESSEGSHITFWVNGGSGVFRRDLWISLGGMDESLFSPFYWEDIDICYRAAKRGYILFWEPKAKVVHEHEGTIGNLSKSGVAAVQERNQLLFIWKNLISPSLFRRHLTGLVRRILRHPGYIKVVLSALPKIKDVLRARRKENKEARISDEAIFARFK